MTQHSATSRYREDGGNRMASEGAGGARGPAGTRGSRRAGAQLCPSTPGRPDTAGMENGGLRGPCRTAGRPGGGGGAGLGVLWGAGGQGRGRVRGLPSRLSRVQTPAVVPSDHPRQSLQSSLWSSATLHPSSAHHSRPWIKLLKAGGPTAVAPKPSRGG